MMFSLSEIASATGGRIINTGSDFIEIGGVSKDTRTVKSGDLYIAIKGERFDGHAFCSDAISKGAVAVLVSDESSVDPMVPAVVVDDTVVAMGQIARHYRFKLGAKVICVTGSVGKTSTREMIVAALKSKKVFSTKKNENNEIGLPMTILEAPSDTEVLVLEMGMRLRGEISYLTNIACPDIAVITNAGYCHIERLGSKEEILYAKSEIVEGLVDGGVVIVNGDDETLFNHIRNIVPIGSVMAAIFAEKITRSAEEMRNCACKLSAENIVFGDNTTSFKAVGNVMNETAEIPEVITKLNGVHNVRNSLFAIMCAYIVGVNEEHILEGLGEYTQMAGRGAITSTNSYTVINDAYNAAPESMEAAFANLNILGESKGGRKIAVLGGILELGDYAPMLHEQVGNSCGKYEFDYVLVTGDNREDFVRGFKAVNTKTELVVCNSNDEVVAALDKILDERKDSNDVILFKASNAFKFEKMAMEYIDKGNK